MKSLQEEEPGGSNSSLPSRGSSATSRRSNGTNGHHRNGYVRSGHKPHPPVTQRAHSLNGSFHQKHPINHPSLKRAETIDGTTKDIQQRRESRAAQHVSDSLANLKACCTSIGSYTEQFSLLFSLPQLVMLSHIQNLLGAKHGTERPCIQPNEYMDNIISNVKLTMKERGLNQLPLPDQDIGVSLYNGQMTGLTNLSRRGDALLEAETDHFILSFQLQARDIRAAYWWRKRKIKGEVSAAVRRVILNLQIKQVIPSGKPPQLIQFEVEEIDGIRVQLHGLGPLNWVVKRALRSMLRRNLKDLLETEGKHIIQQELSAVSITDELTYALFPVGM